LIFCLVGLCATLSSIATYQASFSEATPQFRCKIPGLENDTFEIASPEHKALVDLYIPRDVSSNSYKGCLLRLNASEVECNSWVYSKEFYERTIISEWDLVCSNIGDKGHFRSLHFMGAFAVIFIGLLSDRFGRKKITFVFIGLSALSFLFRALLVNLIVDKSLGKLLFGASKFLIGFTSNIYGIATVLSLELVGPSYRLLANNFMNYFYILGEFVVLLVSYFNRDHRVFSIYMTVLVASLLTYFWWIPESVRFLIGRKKYDRADAVFRRIAKSNKKVLNI
jgi:OCT family organic cation transporter-like MFS transporter 4/5